MSGTPSKLRWSIPLLLVVLLFQAVWRSHTFGDAGILRPLVKAGLVAGGDTEPLDCDESIYAYMGRRMTQGDVLYRDLSENKPPLGYWLYGLAVKIGGANETAIRLMPYPFVLATTVLIWWIARRLAGDAAGLSAAFLFALVDTDPYLFGNGANLEHEMNFFAVASLACFLEGWKDRRTSWLFASGVLLGAECLIKQTAVLPLVLFVPALALQGEKGRIKSTLVFLGGCAAIAAICLGILATQGALREGFDHFVTWALALSREAPPDPGAPPSWMRWLTGNADPKGRLPWPFGSTDYLVWWGTGAWPLWLLFPPAAVALAFVKSRGTEARLVGLWTLVLAAEVLPSGLYWQHYYLLPVPGLAIALGTICIGGVTRKRVLTWVPLVLLIAAAGWTIRIQVRDYWLLPPDRITARWKGGEQWNQLRQIGVELRDRVKAAGQPLTMYVWGWQSPLYLYGEFDAPTPYAFADPLLKALSSKDHPLIRPRVERIVSDLKAKPPTLIFVADLPFPALRDFLDRNYVRSYTSRIPNSPDGRGLWVLQSASDAYERAGVAPIPGR